MGLFFEIWDFCVFFFLLFFIFRHRTLFFLLSFSFLLLLLSIFLVSSSLLVCAVSVQSHRTWSTVSTMSQKGHCGHSWSMGSSRISRSQSGDYNLFPSRHASCFSVIFVFYLSSFHVVASVSPSLFSDLCRFCLTIFRDFLGGILRFCMSSSSAGFASSSAC
jgi:hypothetical protein